MDFINIENLNFSYDGSKVLENISLDIAKDEFLCITGINGAGKSTFIKLLLGFLQPESGSIKYNFDKNLSYVSQTVLDINKSLPITVGELVSLSLISEKKLSKKDKNDKVDKILKDINILDIKNKKIGELSGGQIQRVFIAKALLNKTNCIVLDEPTASIDKKSVSDICCLLAKLNKQGITIIMITHDVNSIISHATKVLNFVEKGKAVEQNTDEYLKMVEKLHKY